MGSEARLATGPFRQVKAVRAVARITQAEVGRYCGEVTLPLSGAWLAKAKHGWLSGERGGSFKCCEFVLPQ